MKMFTEKFIQEKYDEIKISWEKNLKEYGVKLSSLKNSDGSYTINALVLVYLYVNFKKVVSKEELTAFIRNMGYDVIDVQQARHLATQNGWYIISGQRGDVECSQYGVSSGQYMLISIVEPYPQYKDKKRLEHLNAGSWEELKNHYNNRCVSCGSVENEKNLLYPNSITKLQQGHKDPSKPLSMDNIIPQCQFCNGASQNFFVFDNKGKVIKIYNPQFILKSDEEIQIEMLHILMEEDIQRAEEMLNKIKEEINK
jgi:hypothetical protein